MKFGPKSLFLMCALFLISNAAYAQGFYMNTASARSAGLGGIYIASSTDALDALSANPAGIAFLQGRNLDLAADAVFARGSFTDSVNDDAALRTSPGVIPYGAFGMPIGHSRFSFAVGATPELLSTADWKYVDAPGIAGATYGLQQQKSAINALRMAAGVGVSFGSKFSLGATVGADYNTNTLQAPYIFQTQPQLAGLKTLLDLHTSGIGWNAVVGALAHPTRKLEVGLAWKSRTVIDSTGTATGDAYAQFAALGVSAPSNFSYSARVQNVLPQSLLASLAWQANSHWLFAFQTNWINWKEAFVVLPVGLADGTNTTINSIVGSNAIEDGVPLHWKDQYAFHVGAERSLTENTTIRAGFAHANSPVPSSTLNAIDCCHLVQRNLYRSYVAPRPLTLRSRLRVSPNRQPKRGA